MLDTKVAVTNRFSGRSGQDNNWRLRVEFDVEEGSVDIFEWHGQNSQTMRSYHNLSLLLECRPACELANADAIEEALNGEELLMQLMIETSEVL